MAHLSNGAGKYMLYATQRQSLPKAYDQSVLGYLGSILHTLLSSSPSEISSKNCNDGGLDL